MSIKTTGNSVTLPAGTLTVEPEPGVDQAELLIKESNPPFENLHVDHLIVVRKNFAVKAGFTLDNGNTINPAAEEVYLRIGTFGMTIPAGKFKSSLQGKLYTFIGRVEGLDIAATFVRGANSSLWTFAAGVNGVNLTQLLPHAPAQVSVELGVGSDIGSDLATAAIFN
jgi:hypothetical protein